MNEITPEKVRRFLCSRYSEQIRGLGLDPNALPDSFDFFLEGAVDSLGILELVSAIEKEFGLELDMSSLDAERMTILGHLAEYVAKHATPRDIAKAPIPPH
jgi:acyl carrier protein